VNEISVKANGTNFTLGNKRGRTAILVPAYNEEDVLDRTLAAAVREAGAENVYVANDASADATARIGEYWCSGNVYTAPENAGKSKGLKAAIDRFRLTERYEGIFILDSDTWLAPGHLAAVEKELTPGTAFVVGRIESDLREKTFWTRYRGFVMFFYNSIIRTPQNALNIINVLPGSSVLLSSKAVEAVNWDIASQLVLDDFSMLCDVRYGRVGETKYVHDTPAALISEPLTWNAYKKQTYGRWWPGIWQTMRVRRMWRRTDMWSVANNVQVLSWVWSAITPLVGLVALWLFWGTLAVWLAPTVLAWNLGQTYFFAILYAWRRGRPLTLVLAPLFLAVAYWESVLFTAGWYKSLRLEEGGRWESPMRTKTRKEVI
jgi:biofilm PGA synthesis N-glycosyltransferase PgaC